MTLVASVLVSGCKNAAPAKNYFAESGIKAETFSNQEMNNHLKQFEVLYNDMAFVVEKKDKAELSRLSIAFSDWILKALSLKDSLPADEQKKFDDYLEKINNKWTEKKGALL